MVRRTAISAVLILATVSFTGCADLLGGSDDPTTTTTSSTSAPAARQPTPAGEESEGAATGARAWAAGAPDGPTTHGEPDPPPFAEPARTFQPSDHEPSRLPFDPGDHPDPDFETTLGPIGPGPSPPAPAFPPDLAAPPGPCPRDEFDQAATSVFDAVVEDLKDNLGFLTANLAVSDQCGLLYEQGYGIKGPRPWADTWVDPGQNAAGFVAHLVEPNGPDTMWRIASLTKPITSAIIHEMVRDGDIGYDDIVFCPGAFTATSPNAPPGGKCLLRSDPATGPGTVFSTVTAIKQTITVADLVEHASGWDRDSDRNGDFMFMVTTANDAVGGTMPPDEDDLVAFGLSQPLWFTPGAPGGASDRYSNFGYMLLGLIIEEWGDKSYLSYLRNDIIPGVADNDIKAARSLPADFDPREPYYPCGGTRSSPFPGDTPDPVCFMYGGIVIEPQLAHGSLLTTAEAIAVFMTDYWVDDFWDLDKGQPRNAYWSFPDGQRGYHNGAYSGVKSIMVQCLNGYNFALLTNHASDAEQDFPYGDTTDALCDSGDDFDAWRPWMSTIWVDDEDVQWTYRHGLSSSDHQAAFDALGGNYVMHDIDCYEMNGQTRYTSIWIRESRSWAARHGLTTAGMQSAINELDGDGFRPVRMAACNVGGTVRWAGIWHHDPDGPPWEAHAGMTPNDFDDHIDAQRDAGFRLRDITAYEDDGEARYAGIWIGQGTGPSRSSGGSIATPGTAVEWQSRHHVSEDQIKDVTNTVWTDGFWLDDIASVLIGDTQYFAAIWTDAAGETPAIQYRLGTADLGDHIDQMQGFDNRPHVFLVT